MRVRLWGVRGSVPGRAELAREGDVIDLPE
jgi:hypothetical protein